jgi:hypothetical protein
MATRGGFPRAVSDQPEEPEQPGTGTALDAAVISPRLLKAGILGATGAAIVFAMVSVGNPRELFANATAFIIALSAPQDGGHEAKPTIQSATADQAFPPAANEAPTRDEIAAPFKAADQSQTNVDQAPTESALGQFRAWAAGQDARAEVRPVQPVQDAVAPVQDAQAPMQDAQAPSVQDARAEIRPVQQHQTIRRVRNARAEIRARQLHRAKLRREQEAARLRVRSAQEALAQERPVQTVHTPSFLESIGLHD